jgi:hypothetical protein
LAEDEAVKQKPQGGKKKRFSSVSLERLEELRQWQTFTLALIIIVAYIVFFWMDYKYKFIYRYASHVKHVKHVKHARK